MWNNKFLDLPFTPSKQILVKDAVVIKTPFAITATKCPVNKENREIWLATELKKVSIALEATSMHHLKELVKYFYGLPHQKCTDTQTQISNMPAGKPSPKTKYIGFRPRNMKFVTCFIFPLLLSERLV